MALIQVRDLTFSYEGSGEPVFEHVSAQLDTDWKLGLIGRNGRGKTTFLRLLMGQLPYSGEITADTEFEYFPFPVRNPRETGAAVAYEACPDLEYWKLERELGRLSVDEGCLSKPFASLSGGERTKFLLAVLFSKENGFLLIDEPTDHLDAEGRRTVGDYLAKKKGFILVSHDRALLDRCTDHILSVGRSGLAVSRGNFSVWYENKSRRDHFELAENERLRRDIRRLKAAAGQAKSWAEEGEAAKLGKKAARKAEAKGNKESRDYAGEQSRRMQMRRKNLERRQQRAIEEKTRLLREVEETEPLKLFPGLCRGSGKQPVLRLREFGLGYPVLGESGMETMVFSGLCMEVLPGEQVLLLGKNGCGKSSILKRIAKERPILEGWGAKAGEDARYQGGFWLDPKARISYVPQDTAFLRGEFRAFAGAVCEAEGIGISLFLSVLSKLGVEREQFEKRLETFSEGQKKKVLLARSLCTPADLYLWDEPLNFIDIDARIQLEQVIKAARPTMLLVEHDERFSQTIAARRVEVV